MQQTPEYTLYHYWRSTSSWRVRWAMAYKNIAFKPIAVSLLDGESESAEHLMRNPAGYVPVLELKTGERLTESLAIIRYLEDLHPIPTLYPGSPLDRARILALAETINAGTQPIQNLSVLLMHSPDSSEQKKWAQHWIQAGLKTYEALCTPFAGRFSHSDELSIADLCLVPQVYNAERFAVDISPFPTISRIYKNCLTLESYLLSRPDAYQPADFKA